MPDVHRQSAIMLGAMGPLMQGPRKLVLVVHAVVVVVCRGALFFPVCLDIAGHLFEVSGGRTSSEVLLGLSVLIGCVHIAMILNAIKDAMFCDSTTAADPGRPLRVANDADPHSLPSAGANGRMHSDSKAARKTASSKSRPDRPRKSKKHRAGGKNKFREADVELDEEMTFGFSSSYDNTSDNDGYENDDDTDTGNGPAATFRTRFPSSNGRMSPTDPLSEQPHFSGAGRMPPPRAGGGRSAGGRDAAASAQARAASLEEERAKLRQDLEDERREQEQKQQQQRERRRAERAAREAAGARPPPVGGSRAEAAAAETVDHAAIFASGVLPAKISHYAMLGVAKSAGPEEIKKAYNKLAMKFHPDKNPAEKAKAEKLFMGIKEAYECISDPLKRRRYDRL